MSTELKTEISWFF